MEGLAFLFFFFGAMFNFWLSWMGLESAAKVMLGGLAVGVILAVGRIRGTEKEE